MTDELTPAASVAQPAELAELGITPVNDPLPELHTFYQRVAVAISPATDANHQLALVIGAVHAFEEAVGRPLTPTRPIVAGDPLAPGASVAVTPGKP